MISLLVFGANGQLARSIAMAARSQAVDYLCIGRDQLDLVAEPDLALPFFLANQITSKHTSHFQRHNFCSY